MMVFRWLFVPVLIAAIVMLAQQHAGYLRGGRATSFRAFLETGGWLIIAMASAAACWGGLESPGTRIVEVSAFVIGLLFVVIGSHTRRAVHPG